MRLVALLLALFVTTSVRAQETSPPDPAEPSATAPSTSTSTDDGKQLGDTGKLGVALLGGGAAAAASTGAATALLDALSRDDQNPDGPPKNPELVQATGFVVVGLMSLSAGVMLIGGALLADDLAD